MKTIRSNAEQLIREHYYKYIEGKEIISLKKWLENESKCDPGFFYWLFPNAENLTGDFGRGITDDQKEEYNNLLSLL